jgi:hypothetical protein
MTGELRLPRLGVALSLLAIFLGFTLGGVFGIAEDALKGHLKASAEAVRDTVYRGDDEAMRQTLDKSWTYMKRSHLHLGAIGTAALAQSLLLVLLDVGMRLKQVASAMLGAGAVGYGLFWLAAGLRAPGLGGTGPAKESLAWLGQPTAALCLVGTVLVLYSLARGTPRGR